MGRSAAAAMIADKALQGEQIFDLSYRDKRCLKALTSWAAPGSGKGTQMRAWGVLPGFYPFAAGASPRLLDPASDLGQRVQPYLNFGDLVSNELVLDVFRSTWKIAIDACEFSAENTCVLHDNHPRDQQQARSIANQAVIQ